jgi:hypothetical protein
MDLFFYGTLMDGDVRAAVCGCPMDRVRPARLSGYRRVFMRGRDYPMLVRSPGSVVDGVLATDIDDACAARLTRYEGDEYVIDIVDVIPVDGTAVPACLYMARPGVAALLREWTLEGWMMRHKRTFLRALARGDGRASRAGQAKKRSAMSASSSTEVSRN